MSEQLSSREPSTGEVPAETPSTTDTAKAEASNLAQTSKDSAGQVAGTAKDQGQQILSEATSQASNLAGEARSQISQQAGQQQERAATTLHGLGDELAGMADQSESGGMASQLVRQASEQVHRVAGWLDSRDPSGLVEDVRDFARRKPGTFLAGAAAAGLITGRATRAGVDLKRDSSSDNDGYPDARYDSTMAYPETASQYPYDTVDVGGTVDPLYGTGGTYAAGTYASGTYAADPYVSDVGGTAYSDEPYTGETAGGTYPNETADPGEPRR